MSDSMNDVIRQGFRRNVAKSEDHTQTGVRSVEELSVEELVDDADVAILRLGEITDELRARGISASEDVDKEEE